MIDDAAIQIVLLTAKRIIESESKYNAEECTIDDSEHIPRLKRIAEAARGVLSEFGLDAKKCDAIHDELVEYARRLYVAVWMQPLPEDDSPPAEEDAIRQFNHYLTRQKNQTRT